MTDAQPVGVSEPASRWGRAEGVPRTRKELGVDTRRSGPCDLYRIPGCFTSIPLSCIFSCSTLGETSNAVARLMYSLVTK